MEETLKLILNELKELKEGQQELKNDISSIKNNLINGLGPYFEHIEKHIDVKTEELKDTLEDQQRVIDTLAARSVKHESEIKDFKRILKNQ
jgi:hemerythrin-like domain-containing protein